MSSYVPTTAREVFDPHHFRTNSKAEKRHGALGIHQAGPPKIDAPPPPTIDDAEGRAQDEGDRLRRRRGRASAILSDRSAPAPLTSAKTLLGA